MRSTLFLLLTPCFCSQIFRSGSWGFFLSFCILLSRTYPNCPCTQLFLVAYSFFLFCCLRRCLCRCKHCSKGSQVPGPSLSQLHQFTFPPTLYEGSLFSTSSPMFVICVLFYNIHSSQVWGDISFWFWFAFPWWLAMLSIFWPSAFPLWKKCLLSSSAHFLIRLFVFLLLSCMSCLYMVDINPLSVISFANIFSHSVGCLFVLSMVSFAVEKLLHLIKFHLFIFAFISFRRWIKKKYCYDFMSKSVLTSILFLFHECKFFLPLWR